MDTTTDEPRLRAAVPACLNRHDLLGVMDHGAPADEYGSEIEDFVRLMAADTPITPRVVAGVWHKWFGDITEATDPATPAMTALAGDLQAIHPSPAPTPER
jgi:hypothetical protein